MSTPHSTQFVLSSSSKPSVSETVSETVKPTASEVVKPIEVSPSRKIRVDLKESKLKESTLSKDKMHGKLFDANELLNNVKTKNMLLLDKVKSLELDSSVARSASSKLNQLLGV